MPHIPNGKKPTTGVSLQAGKCNIPKKRQASLGLVEGNRERSVKGAEKESGVRE